jgi:hypothetical protein
MKVYENNGLQLALESPLKEKQRGIQGARPANFARVHLLDHQVLYAVPSNGETLSEAECTLVIPVPA